MQQAVTELFDRYVRETNRGLTGEPDQEALGRLYADSFIGAGPSGVLAGRKDEEFPKVLAAGLARYRAIGTREMAILDLRVEPIDAMHALAHVGWRARYDVRDTQKHIDFTNVYLVRVDEGGARVFGWITGDEDAELRKYGVID